MSTVLEKVGESWEKFLESTSESLNINMTLLKLNTYLYANKDYELQKNDNVR